MLTKIELSEAETEEALIEYAQKHYDVRVTAYVKFSACFIDNCGVIEFTNVKDIGETNNAN